MGSTPAAVEAAASSVPAGSTITCVAAMVVESTVPRTTTSVPSTMALAVVEAVPFAYVVEEDELTVTFWPAPVVTVKPDEVTLPTVPDAPPSAGPDRALDAPPLVSGLVVVPVLPLVPGTAPAPAAGPPPLSGKRDVAAAADTVDVVARAMDSPITAHVIAAAATHPLVLCDSTRHVLAQSPGLAGATADAFNGSDEFDGSGAFSGSGGGGGGGFGGGGGTAPGYPAGPGTGL